MRDGAPSDATMACTARPPIGPALARAGISRGVRLLLDYLKYVGLGLVALLPVANPLTSTTLLLALSRGYTTQERNHQIDRATIYVAAIILVCFYAGNAIDRKSTRLNSSH